MKTQNKNSRRDFIKVFPAVPVTTFTPSSYLFFKPEDKHKQLSHKFKLSLKLYSFNDLLRNGKVDLSDMVDFCACYNFDLEEAFRIKEEKNKKRTWKSIIHE